tara:strand:+ start:1963 stop:4173 length:2211 start_codon:yes stop_codon:yes gene_type:complete
MVLDNLRNFFPNYRSKYPKGFQSILEAFSEEYELNQSDIDLLWSAYKFGEEAHKGQKRKSGVPYFDHCIQVCIQLISWHMDIDTLVAGLLHDTVEDTVVTKKQIEKEFNDDIGHLVYGVSKLSGIKFRDYKHRQAENLMKMFLAVAKDLRVIIIKFSDRLHNMKTLDSLPKEKQIRISEETRNLYAPLAHRLGMNQLKMEYENLILKYTNRDAYDSIKKKLNTTNRARAKYIEEFIKPIKEELSNFSFNGDVFGRAKHYYSIYRKMESQSKKFSDLYDLFAIRIVVDKIEECYTVLGIVHQLYTPMQERFKDYIATPKSNGYQSIHTTVFGQNEKIIEIQIRTKSMDQLAEVGVAAHWIYKEQGHRNKHIIDSKMDSYVEWLRDLVDIIKSEDKDPAELLELLKIDLFDDEIFVFTPTGDVHQLKRGSTPIDFAFSIHTQVGMKCSGAKIEDKIIPLNSELKNGDTVKIITSPNQTPNQAWLKIVKTTKAITHIKRYLKKEEEIKSIELGKEMLEKSLRKIKKLKLLKIIINDPHKMGYNNSDLIFSNFAKGKHTFKEILEKYDVHIDELELDETDTKDTLTQRFLRKARGIAKGVRVGGIDNAMISFPKCCSPIPGDNIIGYITRGKGVTVHRVNCSNLPIKQNKDRFIDVEWDLTGSGMFLVRLKIVFEDRKDLLKDLTESTSSLNINIKSVDISALDGLATCLMIIEVKNINELETLQQKIVNSVNPMKIERV